MLAKHALRRPLITDMMTVSETALESIMGGAHPIFKHCYIKKNLCMTASGKQSCLTSQQKALGTSSSCFVLYGSHVLAHYNFTKQEMKEQLQNKSLRAPHPG